MLLDNSTKHIIAILANLDHAITKTINLSLKQYPFDSGFTFDLFYILIVNCSLKWELYYEINSGYQTCVQEKSSER